MSDKNRIVLWSGGLTSTYHLLQLCAQTDDFVYAVFVYDDNVPCSKQQRAHIKALKNRIKSITGKTIKLRNYQIDANSEPTTLNEKAILAISYAYGLQNVALHYHFESSTIKQICEASNIQPVEQTEQPPEDHLSNYFNSLYWLTWNCQTTDDKSGCGHCDGCLRYQTIQK